MELKEYYEIIRKNTSVLVYTIVIVVIVVYTWSIKKSETYSTSFILNIGRTEEQSTSDYRYDQFYRIQADDKFADTVSEWLKMPGIVQEISDRAGLSSNSKSLRQLAKTFGAEKMSSQIIEVRFSPANPDEAGKISSAIASVISDKTKALNADAHDPNWFKVDSSNLITAKNVQDLRLNLSVASLAGLMLGIFLAFIKHYLSEES
jgi:capsular polysaccharide biosynthesis protein